MATKSDLKLFSSVTSSDEDITIFRGYYCKYQLAERPVQKGIICQTSGKRASQTSKQNHNRAKHLGWHWLFKFWSFRDIEFGIWIIALIIFSTMLNSTSFNESFEIIIIALLILKTRSCVQCSHVSFFGHCYETVVLKLTQSLGYQVTLRWFHSIALRILSAHHFCVISGCTSARAFGTW